MRRVMTRLLRRFTRETWEEVLVDDSGPAPPPTPSAPAVSIEPEPVPESLGPAEEPDQADAYPPEETDRFRKPSAAELSASGPVPALARTRSDPTDIELWRGKVA